MQYGILPNCTVSVHLNIRQLSAHTIVMDIISYPGPLDIKRIMKNVSSSIIIYELFNIVK